MRVAVERVMPSVFLQNSAVLLDLVGRSLWEDEKGERRGIADAPERFYRGFRRVLTSRNA